jgi:transcriptional regulator with GAF, ATPase, and Fis domain
MDKLLQPSQNSSNNGLDAIIVGQTPAMVELKRHIFALGKTDLTVLITGESGTGKELVARAIHQCSPRSDRPFVKVNSAAVPPRLFESELFGFEKGAFTGACKKKRGKFQMAHSGTILLDEISGIPLTVQGKLLQVLEDNEFSPLGSTTNAKIDALVLVATNDNLSQMVSQGHFRLDLYYRINVVSVRIPPLRDRKGDIDLLCEHFLQKYAPPGGRTQMALTARTREQFYQYSWPGNVRELENVIQAIASLGNEESFHQRINRHGFSGVCRNRKAASCTLQSLNGSTSQLLTRYTLKDLSRKAARKAETDTILDALTYTHWNRRKAAALLKTSYRTLLSKIKEYEIQRPRMPREDGHGKTCRPAAEPLVSYLQRPQKGAKRNEERWASGGPWSC